MNYPIMVLLLLRIQSSKLNTGNTCCQRNKYARGVESCFMKHCWLITELLSVIQNKLLKTTSSQTRGEVRMLGWMLLSRWMTGSLARRICENEVQAIRLVLAKREFSGAVDGAYSPPSSCLELPKVKAILLICPTISVTQWVNEFCHYIVTGCNKVLVYHGSKRGMSLHEFSNQDLVITTYSSVKAECRYYRRQPSQTWIGMIGGGRCTVTEESFAPSLNFMVLCLRISRVFV